MLMPLRTGLLTINLNSTGDFTSWGGAQGQATDIEIHAREILRLRADLNKILAERTGQPLEKIERDTERDYYMAAAEAADYGLVDRVIDKRGA